MKPSAAQHDRKAIERAAAILRAGGLVAFPTETVYGLGANALDAKAVAKIFAAKGRPSDNPLIVHVSDRRMLQRVVRNVPAAAERLIERFWPGPLTILFAKKDVVPAITTAGLDSVAVRIPAHPIALALIRAAGLPLAAPSANRSGRPSPTTAAHVRADFPRIPVIDGGPTEHGLESTVVSVEGTPRVLRLGAVTLEELRAVVPHIRVDAKLRRGQAPSSPGLKYRHYAPKLPLTLYRPASIDELRAASERRGVVVLCREKYLPLFPNAESLGRTTEEMARNLFDALRDERPGIRRILVLGVPRRGIGRTLMDRLEKAASEVV